MLTNAAVACDSVYGFMCRARYLQILESGHKPRLRSTSRNGEGMAAALKQGEEFTQVKPPSTSTV
jgi:hypothetical protein